MTPEEIKAALETALKRRTGAAEAYMDAREIIHGTIKTKIETLMLKAESLLDAYERVDLDLLELYRPATVRVNDRGHKTPVPVQPHSLRFEMPRRLRNRAVTRG